MAVLTLQNDYEFHIWGRNFAGNINADFPGLHDVLPAGAAPVDREVLAVYLGCNGRRGNLNGREVAQSPIGRKSSWSFTLKPSRMAEGTAPLSFATPATRNTLPTFSRTSMLLSCGSISQYSFTPEDS